jgi:hypothetical protein
MVNTAENRKTVKDLFQSLFHKNFDEFHDKMLSTVMRLICMDWTKFDSFLHKEFGDYEDQKQSMMDIVEEKYGKPARELLVKLS